MRMLAHYGVAWVKVYGGSSLPQVKCAAIEIEGVPYLVAVDERREVIFQEPITINGGALRSATPATLQLASGENVDVRSAGCGCGSPLKAIDVLSVLQEKAAASA